MAREDRTFELYMRVKKFREIAETRVIPDGEIWEIQELFGDANPSRDTSVGIQWDYEGNDPEIIANAYGSIRRGIQKRITGDGVKELALVLRNNSSQEQILGARITIAKVD